MPYLPSLSSWRAWKKKKGQALRCHLNKTSSVRADPKKLTNGSENVCLCYRTLIQEIHLRCQYSKHTHSWRQTTPFLHTWMKGAALLKMNSQLRVGFSSIICDDSSVGRSQEAKFNTSQEFTKFQEAPTCSLPAVQKQTLVVLQNKAKPNTQWCEIWSWAWCTVSNTECCLLRVFV